MKQEDINEEFIIRLNQHEKEEYPITEEEKAHIKEKFLSGLDDSWFNDLEYYMTGIPEVVLIRTPKRYWMSLMGRSWLYDKNDDTLLLWSLN